MVEEFGFSLVNVSSDMYDFMDTGITSFGVNTLLITSKDTPDNVVYDIVKAMNENIEYMQAAYAPLRDLTLEKMANGLGSPVHPGAQMYYDEMGVGE